MLSTNLKQVPATQAGRTYFRLAGKAKKAPHKQLMYYLHYEDNQTCDYSRLISWNSIVILEDDHENESWYPTDWSVLTVHIFAMTYFHYPDC